MNVFFKSFTVWTVSVVVLSSDFCIGFFVWCVRIWIGFSLIIASVLFLRWSERFFCCFVFFGIVINDDWTLFRGHFKSFYDIDTHL